MGRRVGSQGVSVPWIRASSAGCVRNSCTSWPAACWPRRWRFARTQACIWISHPFSPPPLLRALSPAPHPPPRAEKTCVDSGKSRRPACGISQHTHGISSHTHEPSHKSQAREPWTRACVLLTRCTDTETRDQEEVGADVGGEQGSTDDSEEADDAVVLLQWAASIGKQHTIYMCVYI